MYFELANVLVFALLAAGFVVVNLFVGRLLFGPRTRDLGEKRKTYECGEPTLGGAWIRFDIRFYTIALMFVVFDVEVALLFPWAVIFRDFVERGLGWLVFLEAATFIVILAAGLAYIWAKKDIDWAPREGEEPRTTDVSRRPERAGRVVAGRGEPVASTEVSHDG